MYQKTSSSEKSRSRFDDSDTSGGVSMPAVKPVQKAGAEEEEPLQGKFATVQKMGPEEEEPLQGKFDTVQKVEEEEPLQGKFATVQKMGPEEEEPLQGKFDTVQKVEEEEPLQGKFATVQKMGGEEEEPLQGKFNTVQKAGAEEEEPLQGKFATIQKAGPEEEPLQGKFHTVQKKKSGANPVQLEDGGGKSNQTGMPDQLKSGIENLSGFAMDDVRVHYNSDKPQQLQAHAYAQGTEIHIGPGQEKHLPHEAWHVAQQKQGRVQPTTQMKEKVPVNDDPGLENEADVMGAKALQGKWVQNSTAQLRFDQGLLSSGSVQRKAAGPAQRKETHPVQRNRSRSGSVTEETAEAKFQRENAGIIAMISNASTVLGDINWGQLAEPGTDKVGAGLAVSGLVGSATGGSGSITNAAQGRSEESNNLMGAAGEITAGIGSSITSLVKAVSAIKKIIEMSGGKEDKIVAGGELAATLLEALKSGCEAAASISQFVNGSVPPGLKQLIPGLGLAVAACDIIVNAYTLYNAYSAKAEMEVVSTEFLQALADIVSGGDAKPKTIVDAVPTLFAVESRGKWWATVSYLRLKPGLFESLEQLMDGGLSERERTQRESNFKSKHPGLRGKTFTVPQLISAIRNYELGSKMEEINQKRKAQGAMNIFTSVLAVAGEIAKFFPADGGITATVLLGASAAIGGANSAAKFINTQARNRGILGADTNRSSTQKHKEYVNHTRSLYQYMHSSAPANEGNKAKVQRAEQLLKATGVNTAAVYSTEYDNASSKNEQVNLIVEAMKAGR